MKRTISFLIAVSVILLPAAGQENQESLKKLENLEQLNKAAVLPDTLVLEEGEIMIGDEEAVAGDTSVFSIGDNAVVIEDAGDETVIRIVHRGSGNINREDESDNRDSDDDSRKSQRRNSFSGHLGGLELGYNHFLTSFWTTSQEPENSFFDLNTSRSAVFNMILPNVSLGITGRFGLVTALGLNFNNYRFDRNNSITVDANGVVIPYYPAVEDIEKSKLATLYAILPVILEAQIPVSHGSSINIGAGIVGAVKLGSHTKVVYYDNGKQKAKTRDDYSLNLLRYGVTGRLGYEMVQLYGTCYLSPMFEKGKAPELYPFEVGIALTIND